MLYFCSGFKRKACWILPFYRKHMIPSRLRSVPLLS